MGTALTVDVPAEVQLALAPEDLDAFFALQGKPGPKARAGRMKLYARYPALALAVGDLARFTQQAVVEATYGEAEVAEVAGVRCEALRRDLAAEGDGSLERLVIERVVVTWLHLQAMEQRRALAWKDTGVTWERTQWLDGLVNRASADHLKACRSLAQVRKLLRPSMAQVNIAVDGGQQVNVGVVEAGG